MKLELGQEAHVFDSRSRSGPIWSSGVAQTLDGAQLLDLEGLIEKLLVDLRDETEGATVETTSSKLLE